MSNRERSFAQYITKWISIKSEFYVRFPNVGEHLAFAMRCEQGVLKDSDKVDALSKIVVSSFSGST